MGRFHRHDDGTVHAHDHAHPHDHDHDHPHDRDGSNDDSPEHRHDPGEHGDHSGYATAAERVTVLERIFSENDHAAEANRAVLDAARVVCLNVMSSPGAGKTTVLEHTLRELQGRVRAGVVEGDIETSIDADRLEGIGAQIALLNTSNGFGGECHLDAPMVASALARLDLDDLDILFVENVGNLVCPAEFDVGAHRRVMVCSITEGEEKPLKYPVMFRAVDLVLINKIDLLPHLEFDLDLFERNLQAVNPGVQTMHVSARSGGGLDAWYAWLDLLLEPATAGPATSPPIP